MISLAQANSMGHGEAEKLRGLQVVHRLEFGYFKNHRLSKISVPAVGQYYFQWASRPDSTTR
jgi:hypothetical protein